MLCAATAVPAACCRCPLIIGAADVVAAVSELVSAVAPPEFTTPFLEKEYRDSEEEDAGDGW